MKLKAHEVERFVTSPNPMIRVILVYGKNRGAIDDVAKRLVTQALGQDIDSRVIELDENALSQNSTCLYDEAATLSMFGKNKVIRVTLSGERYNSVIIRYLEDIIAEAFVVIIAGNLTLASRLRKMIEDSEQAMALPCYEDDIRDIQKIARTHLEIEGFKITNDALNLLSQKLSSDRGVTKQELERLILFVGPLSLGRSEHNKEVTIIAEDIELAMSDVSRITLDALIDIVILGQLKNADRALQNLTHSGVHATLVLGRLRKHFQDLHFVQGQMEAGEKRGEVMRMAFRPPLHFKRQKYVEEQLRLWSYRKLESVLTLLHDTERECRQSGSIADILAAHTLLRITRAVKRH